jgi:hypothetical protein
MLWSGRAARRGRWIAAALFGVWAATVPGTRAADHLDSPRVKTFHPLDINDVYVFQSPTHPANTVVVVTVIPFAGFLSPTEFSPVGDYEIKIDNTGDNFEDITYRFSFSLPNRRGAQRMTVERIDGDKDRVIAQGLTARTIPLPGGGRTTAGLFDDPFFFDLNAFNTFKATRDPNAFCHPGRNFFFKANVMAIVLEVPSVQLVQGQALPNIGVWARTTVNGEQFDRMGRAAINTALIPDALKDAFNSGVPHTDRLNFWDTVLATLKADGNPPDEALDLVMLLLPDLNTFDVTDPKGFPNGRRLDDDVIDIEFGLILKHAGVTTDCVGNDSDFRFGFPYLAVANRYK